MNLIIKYYKDICELDEGCLLAQVYINDKDFSDKSFNVIFSPKKFEDYDSEACSDILTLTADGIVELIMESENIFVMKEKLKIFINNVRVEEVQHE